MDLATFYIFLKIFGVITGSEDGEFLLKALNLSDLANKKVALANIGFDVTICGNPSIATVIIPNTTTRSIQIETSNSSPRAVLPDMTQCNIGKGNSFYIIGKAGNVPFDLYANDNTTLIATNINSHTGVYIPILNDSTTNGVFGAPICPGAYYVSLSKAVDYAIPALIGNGVINLRLVMTAPSKHYNLPAMNLVDSPTVGTLFYIINPSSSAQSFTLNSSDGAPLITSFNPGRIVILSLVSSSTAGIFDIVYDSANIAAKVAKSGDTMTGPLILSGDPVSPLGAVTKQYNDSMAAGLSVRTTCRVATTFNLNATYFNGVGGVGATLTNAGFKAPLLIDDVLVNVGDRVLTKNQTSALQNGLYVVTNAGSNSINWVLTRAPDFNAAAANNIVEGAYTILAEGTVNATNMFTETGAGPFTVGTTPIVFSPFNSAANINAGYLLLKSGNTLLVDQTFLDNEITDVIDAQKGEPAGLAYLGPDGIITVPLIPDLPISKITDLQDDLDAKEDKIKTFRAFPPTVVNVAFNTFVLVNNYQTVDFVSGGLKVVMDDMTAPRAYPLNAPAYFKNVGDNPCDILCVDTATVIFAGLKPGDLVVLRCIDKSTPNGTWIADSIPGFTSGSLVMELTGLGFTGSTTWTFSKNGNVVKANYLAAIDTATISGPLVGTEAIPVQFRPAINFPAPIKVIDNFIGCIGAINVNTSGLVSWESVLAGQIGNFSGSGDSGIYAGELSWITL